MTPDLLYDQMIGSGCARKLVFSWGGNPGVGSLHRLRDAVEQGGRIRSSSRSTATRPWPTHMPPAPAACLPPSFGAIADRIWRTVNPNIKFVPCPFTGESLACVPALRPDVAIVHAQKADRAGQRPRRGDHRRAEGSRARRAPARIVTVEEVVERLRRRRDERGDSAVLGRSARSRSFPAARTRLTRMATTPATTRSISRGTRSRAIASRFAGWMRRACVRRAPDVFRGAPTRGRTDDGDELFRVRNDDRRRGARARQRRHLFRRHRAAVGRVQPRALDARPKSQARVRVGHARDEAAGARRSLSATANSARPR